MMIRTFALTAVLLTTTASYGFANSPPASPVILEPGESASAVSPWDVHMVSGPFSDPNPADVHRCTDWEIRTAEERTLVWSAPCASGPLALHIHLGDGAFHEVTALSYASLWVLRVRHFDSSGDPETEASFWSEREFATGDQMLIHPMILRGISDDPPPRWIYPDGQPVELADSGGAIAILSGGNDPLARFSALRWQQIVPPDSAPRHHPAVVLIEAASDDLELPITRLEIYDYDLVLQRIYLPAFTLTAGATLTLHVASDGSTYYVDPNVPQFGSLARSSPVPWTIGSPALRLERIATGFQLPVDLAFAPSPSDEPDAPWMYVAELYGTIKVIARDGGISDYATGLLDFGAEGPFPGTGEQGIGGIAVEPETGDLFVTLPLLAGEDAPAPRVIRLWSADEGRTAAGASLVFKLEGLEHVASHQISNVSIGPDQKLYVHVGDGSHFDRARDPDMWNGKILRANFDGTAPADNPFYDSSDGITPKDYVFALGFRNPFGGAWRAADNHLYVVDNGPGIDRFVQAASGQDLRWDGTDDSMIENALFNFIRAAPVRVAFLQSETAGGSEFPENYLDSAVITESGPTWSAGPQTRGKRVSLLRFDDDGSIAGSEELVRYAGFGRGTAAGLAVGEDGIYFSDLYPDTSPTPFDRGASIFRIRYGGEAKFALRLQPDDPMTVEVVDRSDLRAATTRSWRFGNEAVDSSAVAAHTFSVPGVHEIRLRVANEREDLVVRAFVSVGHTPGSGLRAEYFEGSAVEGDPVVTRLESAIDHDWGEGAPDAALPADDFTVRWSGTLIPRVSGRYEFDALADDGIRLWIDGFPVIDAWFDGSWESGGTIALVAGRPYQIRVEYYERAGSASVRLFWTPPFGERELVPPSVLYRPTGRGRIAGRTPP